MNIKNLKEGQIISVVNALGFAPEAPEKVVSIDYIIGTVHKIDIPHNLVQVTNNPDVVVAPQYIYGIPINELVLKQLGWNEIEIEKINVPKHKLSSIKTGYERGKYQVFQEFDEKFYFIRSRSCPLEHVEYVHDFQKFNINDLDPSKLLDK